MNAATPKPVRKPLNYTPDNLLNRFYLPVPSSLSLPSCFTWAVIPHPSSWPFSQAAARTDYFWLDFLLFGPSLVSFSRSKNRILLILYRGYARFNLRGDVHSSSSRSDRRAPRSQGRSARACTWAYPWSSYIAEPFPVEHQMFAIAQPFRHRSKRTLTSLLQSALSCSSCLLASWRGAHCIFNAWSWV